MKRRNGPDWKKKHEDAYWAAQGILGRPGAFVRSVDPKSPDGGTRFEVIVPGDWTAFESYAFPRLVFEALVEDGYLEATERPFRWRSIAVREKGAPSS